MDYMPCCERTFLHQINFSKYYALYLRWFRHLSERLGLEDTISIWENAFANYDDEYLIGILSYGWTTVESDQSNWTPEKINNLISACLLTSAMVISTSKLGRIINNTPPLFQIKRFFSNDIVEREITAYDALHIRFDGFAYLAEAIIEAYGKQGEFIVYDLVVADRLADSEGQKGTVKEFIANFMSKPDTPNLFTAGLEIQQINQTRTELVINVLECEWARYFRERHPQVGYLMACSTDEIAYKDFNSRLRLQRTQTIMEGHDKCDFRIFTIDDNHVRNN